MSAEGVLHAAMLAALRGNAVLATGLNGVFEGPATKATPPYAELGELVSVDWGTKDRAGRELRVVVTVRDAAAGPGRIHDLAAAAGSAIGGVPRGLNGWRVASVVPVRTRIVRSGPGKWTALVDYRVRMMEDL